MIVRTMPKDLSEAAHRVYRAAALGSGYISSSRWGQKEYVSGYGYQELDASAIDELVEAGIGVVSTYGTQDGPPNLHVYRVHPLYSNLTNGAEASGYDMYVEVWIIDEESGGELLLLTLSGASVSKRDDLGRYRMPTWKVNLRHNFATDFEHDSAFLAWVSIENPVFTDVSAYGTTMVGRVTEARFYGRGVDPFDGEESGECDGEGYHSSHDKHPIIAYQPEENEDQAALRGSLVKVVATVRTLVDENGRFIKTEGE